MRVTAVLLLIAAWQVYVASARTSTCSVSIAGTPAGDVQAARIACSGPVVQMTGAAALQAFAAGFEQGAPRPMSGRLRPFERDLSSVGGRRLCRTACLPAPTPGAHDR